LSAVIEADGQRCGGCATRFPEAALACPSCHKLVHGEALRKLSEEANTAARAGQPSAELAAWRSALALLPPASRQHAMVLEKTRALSVAVDANPAPGAKREGGSGWGKATGGLGALALVLWKFKALGLFALTKLKFLLLGLTKAQTLLSMLFAMGVYFTLWGWKFAVGFVLSIYVHEMGHVAALVRLGIPASAPMFIPGVGAYVRLHQSPATPAEDARVGLAGPIWGLGAAAACAAVYATTTVPIWGALAKTGAYLNLFNLLPIWQLDGARGFAALAKPERIWIAVLLGGAWALTQEGLLIALAALATYRAFASEAPASSDRRAFIEFGALVVALSWLMHLDVPTSGR
jgi:Zn-dependent protease